MPEPAPELVELSVPQKVGWCLQNLGASITLHATGSAQLGPLRQWTETGVMPPGGIHRSERVELTYAAALAIFLATDRQQLKDFFYRRDLLNDDISPLEIIAKDELVQAQTAIEKMVEVFLAETIGFPG